MSNCNAVSGSINPLDESTRLIAGASAKVISYMPVLLHDVSPCRRHRLTGGAPVRQLETRSHMIVDIPENR